MAAFVLNSNNITYANPGFNEYKIPKQVKFIQDGNEESYVFQDVASSGQFFSISFDESSELTYIGAYACYGCSYLKKINFTNAKNLKIICGYAFTNCESLISLEFPSSLERIQGYAAFQGCTSLTTVIFPDNCHLKHLSPGAFRGTGLLSIRIPSNCSYLNGETFGYSPLKEITVEEGNKNYAAYENSLYTIDFQKLIFYCPDKTTLNIHPNTTAIAGVAFEGYKYSLIVPNQICKYENLAFYNCKGTSIWITNPPETITTRMFQGCTNLKSLYFFDIISSIDSMAFINSTKLSFIFFLMPVYSIASDAFRYPELICFSGNVSSVRGCLPNVAIHECFLTVKHQHTFSAFCYPAHFSSFICVILLNIDT